MADRRYQVTRFGSGFHGRGQTTLDEAMDIAREKLSKIDGQYHFRGDDERHLGRPEIVRRLEERVNEGDIGEKFVVMGANYDQPGVSVRIIPDAAEESPLVIEARKYLGQKYVFGHIFPPDGDCSGLVVRAVRSTHDISLPHLSEGIRVHEKVRTFRDPDDSESGDFIFYHFSDRNGGWPHADDITMVVDDDMQIGARPSRGGVAIFERDPERQWLVEYGRLNA
jgi:hypothetical protein